MALKTFTIRQVLNLFLALLLSNFGSSNLSAPTADTETNKIAEAFNRISRFKAWVKRSFVNMAKAIRAKLTNQISDQTPGEGPSSSWKEGLYPITLSFCVVYSFGLRFYYFWFFITVCFVEFLFFITYFWLSLVL